MSSIQSKITRDIKKQKNLTLKEEKYQSIETDLEIIQITELEMIIKLL